MVFFVQVLNYLFFLRIIFSKYSATGNSFGWKRSCSETLVSEYKTVD